MRDPKPELKDGAQRINKSTAVHGFAWTFGFNAVNRVVLPLLNAVLIARVLGPEIVGAYAIVYGFFMTAEIFRDAGLTITYMRDQTVDHAHERTYLTLSLLQSAVPALALASIGGLVGHFYESPDIAAAVPWVCLTLLINGFGTVPRAKVLKLGKIKESGLRELVANVASLAVAIAMVQMGYGFKALVAQLVVNAVLNVVIAYPLAPLSSVGFGFVGAGRVVRESISTFGVALLFKIYQLVDSLIIGKLLGNAAAGLYSQARNLAQKPLQLVTVPLTRPLQVAFSQYSDDPDAIGRILCRSLGVATLFVLPLFWLVAIAAEPLTLLLLGPSWIGAVPAMQILCVYFAVRTVGLIANSALVAGGFSRHSMTSHLIGFAAVAVSLAFLPSLDLPTLSWTFSMGMAVISILQTWFALKSFRVRSSSFSPLRKQVAVTLITSVLLSLLLVLSFDPWAKLAIGVVGGSFVHILALGLVLRKHAFAFASAQGLVRLYRTL